MGRPPGPVRPDDTVGAPAVSRFTTQGSSTGAVLTPLCERGCPLPCRSPVGWKKKSRCDYRNRRNSFYRNGVSSRASLHLTMVKVKAFRVSRSSVRARQVT